MNNKSGNRRVFHSCLSVQNTLQTCGKHQGVSVGRLSDLQNYLQAVEIPAFVPSQGWTTFDPRGSVVLSAVFDHPKTLKPKEAATISLRDYARLWTVITHTIFLALGSTIYTAQSE